MDAATLELLCSCYPHDPSSRASIIEPQFYHRYNLTTAWSVQPGWQVLDIGCGQGDSALVLAHVVGPEGRVTGLDPAPLDYGSPYTLGQAQAYLSASALGPRIHFKQSDAPTFLASPEGKSQVFDAATLCHSLWYFATREQVAELFKAIAAAGNIKRLCVAEYTGHARTEAQVPHELAFRAQKRLHRVKKQKDDQEGSLNAANVREALEPPELILLAEQAGWVVKEQGVVEAPTGMLDGYWEVLAVKAQSFKEAVLAEKLDKEQEDELLGYISKVETLTKDLKKENKRVSTMDVTWVVFEL